MAFQHTMRIMVWNCQGAGSPLTIPHLKETNQLFSPSIVFLSETKNRQFFMKKMQRIRNCENDYVVEAVNRAGGMALFWKNEVKVKEVLQSAFAIEAHIEDQDSKWDCG